MIETEATTDGASRLIDSIEEAEHASLEAVRRFVDTVDGAFPHLSDDEPRRKIIDAAFKMTEQLVASTNRFTQNVLDVTEKAMSQAGDKEPAKE